jgi:hypothetical protein
MAQYFEFLCKLIHLIYNDHLGTVFIAIPISSSFPVIFIVVIDVSQSLWDELKKYQTKIMNDTEYRGINITLNSQNELAKSTEEWR